MKAVDGIVQGTLKEGLPIRNVSTDTRTLENSDIFFALKGPHFNGHDFIKEAAAKGALHVVVSDLEAIPADLRTRLNVIFVDDTIRAYGDLARYYRQKFKIPVVAVTGSCGKTTVKELLAHLLSQHFKVLKNKGTENNLIGVPKTIFALDTTHQVLVLEIGTSLPGEISRLASIISPQIAVVTQIGAAHLEGLKDLEAVREEKLSLRAHLSRGGTLILNGDDPMLADAASGVHKVLYAAIEKTDADLRACEIWGHDKGASFSVTGGGRFDTQLIGRHNILNILLAFLAAKELGINYSLFEKYLPSFKPVPGRLCMKEIDGINFIDDSYNANPQSFRAALEILKEFKIRDKKGVVCGDMLELGPYAEKYHRELGASLAEMLFDFVIAAGPLSKFVVEEALKNGFPQKKITSVKDSEEAGRLCRQIASAGDIVLVKGSRALRMEKVFECFTTSFTR